MLWTAVLGVDCDHNLISSLVPIMPASHLLFVLHTKHKYNIQIVNTFFFQRRLVGCFLFIQCVHVNNYPLIIKVLSSYLFGDPAVFSCCAALLIQEGIEVGGFNAATVPVFVSMNSTCELSCISPLIS